MLADLPRQAALLRPCCSRNASSSLTIASICAPALASALLAGVLLPVCLSPARSLVAYPGLTAPMVGVWLVLTRFARRLAVPAAFAAAAATLVD